MFSRSVENKSFPINILMHSTLETKYLGFLPKLMRNWAQWKLRCSGFLPKLQLH